MPRHFEEWVGWVLGLTFYALSLTEVFVIYICVHAKSRVVSKFLHIEKWRNLQKNGTLNTEH